jgi:hypothetical protein
MVELNQGRWNRRCVHGWSQESGVRDQLSGS